MGSFSVKSSRPWPTLFFFLIFVSEGASPPHTPPLISFGSFLASVDELSSGGASWAGQALGPAGLIFFIMMPQAGRAPALRAARPCRPAPDSVGTELFALSLPHNLGLFKAQRASSSLCSAPVHLLVKCSQIAAQCAYIFLVNERDLRSKSLHFTSKIQANSGAICVHFTGKTQGNAAHFLVFYEQNARIRSLFSS